MKPNFSTYLSWCKNNLDIDLEAKPASIYEFVIAKLKKDIQNGHFWADLQTAIANLNDEYYLENEYPLLRLDEIQLHTKPYSSLIQKSFRKNIIQNSNFPDPPKSGWVTPYNWFEIIKDLIRTTITVRYLDGVKFTVDGIQALAKKHNYKSEVDFEAREEGYYAAHITIYGKYKIVDENWNEKEIVLPMEIQVTTQLQDVIKGLLHKMYEDTRILAKQGEEYKWQWDYKSIEFSSNYLGHILHYVEGMILDVRNKQKTNIKKDETGI